jgi:uncharacterized DUF497 family protein
MRFTWTRTRTAKTFASTTFALKLPFRFSTIPAITQRDYASSEEERRITLGAIGPGSILLVVHTFYENRNEEIIRIISARAVESRERKAYEEAHQGAEARYPSHRRKKRPRH